MPDGVGASLDDVSVFDEESEVVVNGPSLWEVAAATMTPTDTLVVVIKRLPDFVSFLTSPGDAHPAAPAAPATSSAVVDPSLQLLTAALVALKIGVPNACADFALSLSQEGVMGTDDLSLFTEAEARDVLSRAGLKELHLRKVMQAIAPPLTTVSFPAIALVSLLFLL